MIKYLVPFYANTSDDLHCFQAALKMVMKYFWPEREYSWEELDRVTAHSEGEWTWPMAGLVWLTEQDVEVQTIEMFDYERFIEEGGTYLIKEFGEEVGRRQIEKSNIVREQFLARDFVWHVAVSRRIPSIAEIERFLEDGYVLIVNVNACIFKEQEGYVGHFVVVTGIDEGGVWLHDPGLPANPDAHVDIDTFERVWAYPNERLKTLSHYD